MEFERFSLNSRNYLQNAQAIRENFVFCDNIDDCMAQLRDDEYLAVGLSRLHAETNPVVSRLERYCFDRENNVYTYSVAMPLKLSFELIGPINAVIKNLMEFGLIDKWKKSNEGPSFETMLAIAAVKQQQEENTGDGTVVLTMYHIVGALIFMGSGYILALAAFLTEKVVHHKVEQRTKSRIILFLHKMLRPNRIDRMANHFCVNNLRSMETSF